MRALCVVVLGVFILAGCEETDIYTIDAPSDLQARIDSIAAAKAGGAGDTTFLDIATAVVGAEDYTSPWWTDFSDYFAVPTGKMLTLEFINHNGGSADNFRNWVLVVTNAVERGGDGYAEYFALRADSAGWGNGDFSAGLISHNYPDTDGDGDIWNDFRSTMDGAYVTLEIDHSATGNVFITGTAVGANGIELVQTYNQSVSATEDIMAFLVADGSYFEMKKAYLLPSQVTAVEDFEPESIEISGAPTAVEKGNENFWGNATATVTFADGSSTQVDSTDLSFIVAPDDMTIPGEKTVLVTYSKTKQGNFTQAVSTYYTLEVTTAIVSIDANDINYYYYSSEDITFNPKGFVVTATFSDNSTAILENSDLEFEYPGTVSPSVGSQPVEITYEGPTNTFTTTSTVNFVQGVDQVGASDFSTPWLTDFSDEYAVASGTSKTIKMYSYSNGLNNYHSPSTILRKTDLTEYAVVRMDNFGWGPGYDGIATSTSDWNWDTFASNIHGSYIEITVTNNGDDTADIRYDVTYASGESHFQEYAGIAIESSDLNFALVLEGAYLVIVE